MRQSRRADKHIRGDIVQFTSIRSRGLTLGLVLLLPACEALEGDNDIDDINDQTATLDELIDTLDPTPVGAMPLSGSARYEGTAFVDYTYEGGNTDRVGGEMVLDADFAQAAVSGRIDSVASDDFGSLDGKLDITNGAISGNGFTADVDGEVGNFLADVRVDGTMTGGFLGDDAQAVSGGISGTARVLGETYPVDGAFQAATD